MKFIKTHKSAVIVTSVCLLLIVVATIAFYKLMYPSNAEDVNGERLINSVDVDTAIINQIIDDLKQDKLVAEVTYEKNVKILKFFIETKSDAALDKAKGLTEYITDKLSEDILSYYDLQVFLTQPDNEKYPAIGYKFKDSINFSWTYDGVEL